MYNIRAEIKYIIEKAGWTLTRVVGKLNEMTGKEDTLANLSKKLGQGTLKYREALEIAEAIDYKIVWVPKDVKID